MLKLCAFLLLLPLGTFAKTSFDPYPTTEPVLKIKANNPQLKGLEVELSNGESVSLREFLEEIAENREELAEYGGEVPWPDNDDGKKGKRKDKYWSGASETLTGPIHCLRTTVQPSQHRHLLIDQLHGSMQNFVTDMGDFL